MGGTAKIVSIGAAMIVLSSCAGSSQPAATQGTLSATVDDSGSRVAVCGRNWILAMCITTRIRSCLDALMDPAPMTGEIGKFLETGVVVDDDGAVIIHATNAQVKSFRGWWVKRVRQERTV